MISLKAVINNYLYEQNTDARKKQALWREKQEDIFYNSGRPIFAKKIEQTTVCNPHHLWYLHEDKYKFNIKKSNIII